MSDVAVVGGGIVGLALARELRRRHPDLRVEVLEKENRVGSHQSGRNSGVVHAGLYYPPGSLKAALCVKGRLLLKDYCAQHQLPYRELGKLVIAVDEDELRHLTDLHDRAIANGVPDVSLLTASGLRHIEPYATGLAALHSPRTAVTDYTAVTERLAADLRADGTRILLSTPVTRLTPTGNSVKLDTPQGPRHAGHVINCAGLHTDRLAATAGDTTPVRTIPFRGEYLTLTPHTARLIRGLIYPVPQPGLPFLGVHLTRTVYDQVWIGPNAVPALAREGYRWRDLNPADLYATLTWPGSRHLAREHWRTGLGEIRRSLYTPALTRQARRYLPQLTTADLTRGHTGVRAQALHTDGTLLTDFLTTTHNHITHLHNAPSPAATASLAIATHIIDQELLR